MNAKPKSNSIITHTLFKDDRGLVLRMNVLGAGYDDLIVDQLHGDIKAHAMVHGLVQRLSDAAALSRNPETGQPATPADKLAAVKARIAHYNSGTDQWAMKRAAGGARDTGGVILQAIMAVRGWTDPATARERIEDLARAKGIEYRKFLNHLATSERVAAEIARIRAAQTDLDADELMDELEG